MLWKDPDVVEAVVLCVVCVVSNLLFSASLLFSSLLFLLLWCCRG